MINSENELIKETKNLLELMSVRDIVKTRDRFFPDSLNWKLYNGLKITKLLAEKPSYIEPLMVVNDNIFGEGLEGFIPYTKHFNQYLESNAYKMIRAKAEYNNQGMRQLVATAIVKCGNSIMLLKRNDKFNDNRLRGYLGFPGGHINFNDGSIYMGLQRELLEELKGIHLLESKITPLGFIREVDKTGNTHHHVSTEHMCCLYLVEVNTFDITSKEKNEKSEWYTMKQIEAILEKNPERLDNWAALAVKQLIGSSKVM